MAERTGQTVLVKVPVGATPTAFLYEKTGTLTISNASIQAINKTTTGFLTQNVTTQTWGVRASCHVDDTDNPALEVVRDAAIAKTLLTACKFDVITTGWLGSGDTYVENFEVTGDVADFADVSFDLLGTGAFAWS